VASKTKRRDASKTASSTAPIQDAEVVVATRSMSAARCTVATLDIERERLRLFDCVPAFAFGQQTSIRSIDPECEIGTIEGVKFKNRHGRLP
jgi:hypothetical protein